MADVAFIGLSILTVGSAIFALESREIIYGAIALAISMLGIAGFFILLDSPFVAMFQISVYVGAVAVLVIFIVMLVRTESLFSGDEDNRGRQIAGLIFSLLAMAGIGVLLFSSLLSNAELKPSLENIVNKIGNGMLTYYSPVFILLGLTLAGSIIGALSLARREEESDQPRSETSPASPQQEKIYLDNKSEGKGAGISND